MKTSKFFGIKAVAVIISASLVTLSCGNDRKSFDNQIVGGGVPVNLNCDSHLENDDLSLIPQADISAMSGNYSGTIQSQAAVHQSVVTLPYTMVVGTGSHKGKQYLAIQFQLQGQAPKVLCAGVTDVVPQGGLTYYRVETNQINDPQISGDPIALIFAPAISSNGQYQPSNSGLRIHDCLFGSGEYCDIPSYDAAISTFQKN